jgi:hypothetical protein
MIDVMTSLDLRLCLDVWKPALEDVMQVASWRSIYLWMTSSGVYLSILPLGLWTA